MKTIIMISWRNVWRNKARSIVIILAIAFGLWGGTFATSFMNGMIRQMFDTSVRHLVSHIQIHNPDFIRERQTGSTIVESAGMINKLENSELVLSYSPRIISVGMINTAAFSSAVDIAGISPGYENRTTELGKNLTAGSYFESGNKNQVLIGEKLAQKTKTEPGNRIVLTFQDIKGNITSAAFKVCGIYRTSNSMNDERRVFVRSEDLAGIVEIEGEVNEIAVLLHNIDNSDILRDELARQFPDSKVRTWAEISPELTFMTEFSGIAMMVLVIIILFAMAFGLLNTMLMTIFERTRELGVLMAVGMNKRKVFMMILLETSFLVITGSIFGSLLGALSVSLTQSTGIDLSAYGGEALSDFGMSAIIYPALDNTYYVNLAILVFITAIAASVYPAYKALRLKPAEAVRKD